MTQHSIQIEYFFSVMMRLRETPVPIPNTIVKTQAADGTWRGTAWESRWLPFFYWKESRDKAAFFVEEKLAKTNVKACVEDAV